jgi:hypothetical protein
MFKIYNSHVLARDNAHAIRKHGYEVLSSVSVKAGIGNIAVGPYLLPEGLTTQRYLEFLETRLQGLLEDVPLAVRQRLWLQHDGVPAHYGEISDRD